MMKWFFIRNVISFLYRTVCVCVLVFMVHISKYNCPKHVESTRLCVMFLSNVCILDSFLIVPSNVLFCTEIIKIYS